MVIFVILEYIIRCVFGELIIFLYGMIYIYIYGFYICIYICVIAIIVLFVHVVYLDDVWFVGWWMDGMDY